MSVVETTADERRILRCAGMLVIRSGLAYVDRPHAPVRAPRGVVDSLLAKELIVKVNDGFKRTDAGDEALAAVRS